MRFSLSALVSRSSPLSARSIQLLSSFQPRGRCTRHSKSWGGGEGALSSSAQDTGTAQRPHEPWSSANLGQISHGHKLSHPPHTYSQMQKEAGSSSPVL